MKPLHNRRFARHLCCFVLLAVGLPLAHGAPLATRSAVGEPAIAPLLHDGHPQRLNRSALRALFLQRVRNWPDGTPVRLVVFPPDSQEHLRFCREVLAVYPYVLSSAWERLIYSGKGFAPRVVTSLREMRQVVEQTPGAIGYAPVKNSSPAADPGGIQ